MFCRMDLNQLCGHFLEVLCYHCIGVLVMAKVGNVEQLKSRCKKQHGKSCKVSPCSHKVGKGLRKKKTPRCTASCKKDWDDARCSICMESPHNAVLLLCSSYNKGCRPYMCDTSSRFSNCLDQYRNANTKLSSLLSAQQKEDVAQLCCPICRGQVKGWAVVERSRKEMNKKKRICMAEKCGFVGNYKELKKHVRAEHPLSRPREVDPALEEKWKTLEGERERNDVISAITSADPGAIVLGDFVIEGGPLIRNLGVGGFLDDTTFQGRGPFGDTLLETQPTGFNIMYEDDYDDDVIGRYRGSGVTFYGASRLHRRCLFGRMMSRRARRNRGNSGC